MANITLYTVENLSEKYHKVFSGIYNDFCQKAFSDYKFELEPLGYEEFIHFVDQGLIKCLIILESNIPTGFLAYTTVISEAIELNIIHCIGEENIIVKKRRLLEKFLEENKELIKQKVVTYPMLGKQADFLRDITHYGFELIGHSVVRFSMSNPACLKVLKHEQNINLDVGYSIVDWNNDFFEDAIKIVYNSFKNSTDAKFDPRFLSHEGVKDIIEKITNSIYGDFLPDITKVLLFEGNAKGICFANITAGTIANIPLIGIEKEHRKRGYGNLLLKSAVNSLVQAVINGEKAVSEVNASVETDNYPALKMYRKIGFKEDYSYAQAFLPVKR